MVEVTETPAPAAEPAQVPAIGYSITANLGGDRQVVFQHFVADTATDEKVNGDLDRIMAFVDRLKARAELPDLRKNLAKHEKALAQFGEDKARLDIDFAGQQARLDVQISALRSVYEQRYKEAEAAFRASGRQGAFNPNGSTKVNLDRVTTEISLIEGEKQKADAERTQALDNLAVSVKRFTEVIDELKAKIAEREAVT